MTLMGMMEYDFGKAAAFWDRWIEVGPRPNWGTSNQLCIATDAQIMRKRGIQFSVSRSMILVKAIAFRDRWIEVELRTN